MRFHRLQVPFELPLFITDLFVFFRKNEKPRAWKVEMDWRRYIWDTIDIYYIDVLVGVFANGSVTVFRKRRTNAFI